MADSYLVDSNVLIDYTGRRFSGQPEQRLDNIFDSIFYYSIISRMEVLGFNAPIEVLANLELFLNLGKQIEINSEVCDKVIAIRRVFPKIKLPDAIIAATAIVNGYVLVSRNTSDFINMPQLRLQDPWEW